MIHYLTENEIVAINYAVNKQFSPTEDFGIKDPKALKAVIAQPKQEVFGEVLYPSIYDKAAILFEMLINKHCFFNGNKRTAVMALYIFLRKNNIYLTANNQEIEDFTVQIAVQKEQNRLTNEEIAEWIEQRSKNS